MILNIKNEKGEWVSIPALKGEKGEPGQDYVLTAADKEEIVNGVLESLPSAEGVRV